MDPFPGVAVTVDMIAAGTDNKPIKALIFMRDVKSERYDEQMRGRGVQTIPDIDLRAVMPDAHTKTRFILIDALSASESTKNASRPIDRRRAVSLAKLMDRMEQGRRDEDALSSLAARLAALGCKLDEPACAKVTEAAGGRTPRQRANALLDPTDTEKQQQAIKEADTFGTRLTRTS